MRNEYPDGTVIAPHHHRRHQLLFGTTGVVIVESIAGTWVTPAQRAMWIPAGTVHTLRIVGQARLHSLYFESAGTRQMPKHCQVLGITSFVRSLIEEAVSLPDDYRMGARERALMKLLEHEVRQLPHLPLSLPLPANPELAQKCQRFLKRPSAHSSLSIWSKELGLSVRTFTRIFRRQTGMSFMHWRQQACLVAALARLSAGESVTNVAIDTGYENPAAFTAMFKRALGVSPRDYMKQSDQ